MLSSGDYGDFEELIPVIDVAEPITVITLLITEISPVDLCNGF